MSAAAAAAAEVATLVVFGVRKFVKPRVLEAHLSALGVEYRKVKVIPRKKFAYVSFENAEQRETARQRLQGSMLNGTALRVKEKRDKADAFADDSDADDSVDGEEGGQDDDDIDSQDEQGVGARGGKRKKKRARTESRAPSPDQQQQPPTSAVDVVTPWHGVPYLEQLQRKQAEMKEECVHNMIRRLRKELVKRDYARRRTAKLGFGDGAPQFPPWLMQRNYASDAEAALCGITVSDIVSNLPLAESQRAAAGAGADVDVGTFVPKFRNKCEFNFGLDVEGQPTVGYRCGARLADHSQHVELPLECGNVAHYTKVIVLALTNFVRASAMPVHMNTEQPGVWRFAMVRGSLRTGDVLVNLCVNKEHAGGEQAWADEQQRLSDMLQALDLRGPLPGASAPPNWGNPNMAGGENPPRRISTLVIQHYDGLSVPDANLPGETIFGTGYITERLFDMRFHISANAFFQVTTEACEVLYREIGRSVGLLPPDLGGDTTRATPSPGSSSSSSSSSLSSASDVQKHNKKDGGEAEGILSSLMSSAYSALATTLGWADRSPNSLSASSSSSAAPATGEATAATAAAAAVAATAAAGTEAPATETTAQPAVDDADADPSTNANGAANEGVGTMPFVPTALDVMRTGVSRKVVVVDVCCGTGSIGICCARWGARRVVGVDMCDAAIQDAARNTALNSIDDMHTRFFAARAEHVTREVLGKNAISTLRAQVAAEDADDTRPLEIVAVVDPPRSGLHHKVIRALRECLAIRRVVYVACNPTKALPNDAVGLCCPPSNKYKEEPFRPVHAIPVDIFPDTAHCEMIVEFQR